MKKFFLLLVLGIMALTAGGIAFAKEGLPHLAMDRGEIDFGECTPGVQHEESFRLVLQDVHPRWAVFVTTEKSKESEKVLPHLSLEGPGVTLQNLDAEARKFLEGRSSESGSVIADVKLHFKPDWTIPPGTYSFRLFFQYLPESGGPEDPPLPVPLKVTVPPGVELTVESEGALRFTVQGSPGKYPLEGGIRLRGRSNAELWRAVLFSEGLRGEKGGVIPPSRLFKRVGDGYRSLEKGFEIGPFPGGEEIEMLLDELYVETLLEDQPDTYEGTLQFRCFFKE